MSAIDVKLLEDFLTLAETRNFSRAAEARFVTQPAFSRRIKSLELWAGTLLVDRSNCPLTLTPAGLAFRDTAEEVLRILACARRELCNGKSNPELLHPDYPNSGPPLC